MRYWVMLLAIQFTLGAGFGLFIGWWKWKRVKPRVKELIEIVRRVSVRVGDASTDLKTLQMASKELRDQVNL